MCGSWGNAERETGPRNTGGIGDDSVDEDIQPEIHQNQNKIVVSFKLSFLTYRHFKLKLHYSDNWYMPQNFSFVSLFKTYNQV